MEYHVVEFVVAKLAPAQRVIFRRDEFFPCNFGPASMVNTNQKLFLHWSAKMIGVDQNASQAFQIWEI